MDVVTVGEQLKNQKLLMEVGGSSYLTDLANVLPTAANIEHYARIVKDKAVLRQLINVSTRIVTSAFSQQEDVADLLDEAERSIFAIAQSKAEKGFIAVSDLVHDVIETVEKLYQRKTHVTGVSTGFTEMDAMTSGFQPSNLIIIAGRPSMGKTSLAMNIAEHVAIHEKKPVAIFSLGNVARGTDAAHALLPGPGGQPQGAARISGKEILEHADGGGQPGRAVADLYR